MKRSLKRKLVRQLNRSLMMARMHSPQVLAAIKSGTEHEIGGVRYLGRNRSVVTEPLKVDGTPGITWITKGIPFIRLTNKPHRDPARLLPALGKLKRVAA